MNKIKTKPVTKMQSLFLYLWIMNIMCISLQKNNSNDTVIKSVTVIPKLLCS